MKGKVPHNNHPLEGVKCGVNSCYYNSNSKYCNAEKIEIQPPGASTTEQTDCVTFAPK